MRLVTFEPAAGCERIGILFGGKVVDLALAGRAYEEEKQAHVPPMPLDMISFLNQGQPVIKAAGEIAAWASRTIEKSGDLRISSGQAISYELEKVRLLAPVLKPPKILCLALNYPAHGGEAKAPMPKKPYIFIKPGFRPVVGPGDKVLRPTQSQGFVYEGELAVVIGKCCRNVPKANAYDVIAGYTAINDMSARDLGMTDAPGRFDWFQAKAFDTSLPMGPCLTFKDEIEDPHKLRLQVRLNGQTVQDASTAEMHFKVPEIIEFVSDLITLDPGDIIATGTPGGSKGALKDGDQVEVEISSIGILPSIIASRGR